jgi:hypothetical protein
VGLYFVYQLFISLKASTGNIIGAGPYSDVMKAAEKEMQ